MLDKVILLSGEHCLNSSKHGRINLSLQVRTQFVFLFNNVVTKIGFEITNTQENRNNFGLESVAEIITPMFSSTEVIASFFR